MVRFQRGSLRKEDRKAGPTWVLRHYVNRQSDGKRVEHKIAIGLVRDFKTESAAWAEVERQHLSQQINEPSSRGRVTFSDIAHHYVESELPERAPSIAYLHRHIVHDFLIPRWGTNIAVGVKPLDVEKWLKALHEELGYANPSCAKIRQVMVCVYKHAQRYGLIPRTEDANPMKWVRCKTTSDYEAILVSPAQAFGLVKGFPPLERTLTLLAAATGLRISECLGLQWQDLDFVHQQIHVRRTWLGGEIGKPKTKASSQPVVMGALLADIVRHWQNETPYSKPQDWVFPSFRLHGRNPRTASIMAQDHLRPAAVKTGILAAEDRRRFGFHNLRHSLASYLVTQTKTDVKTVQSMLRHADIGTTLDIYTHAINKDKLVAQNQVMEAMMMKPGLAN
jgi:integrase